MNTIRLAVAIVLCFLIWIGWEYINPRPQPEVTGDATAQVEATPAPAAGSVEPTAADDAAAPPTGPAVETVSHTVSSELLGVELTNAAPMRGGLVEHTYMRAEKFEGHATGSDPFGLIDGKTLEVTFPDSDFALPRNAAFRVIDAGSTSFTVGYTTNDVEITERFEILDGYEARLTVSVKNLSQASQNHNIAVRTRIGVSESRYDIRRGLCRTADDLEDEDTSDVDEGPERYEGVIRWGGVDSKYFTTTVVPTEAMRVCEVGLEEGRFLYTALLSSPVSVGPGETKEHVFGLYIGAKELEGLQGFSAVTAPGLEEGDLQKTMDWGFFGKYLGRLLLGMMRWFYELVGSWGLSIVLLTVAVKIVTLPLTLKQMHSMRRMKELQPELVKLREKYADDRVKQAQEMQALYGRSGVNPLAGCLPMLVQLPIWFALYSMLGAAVELLHVDFLWLPDLTEQDPYYVLPLAIGALMVLQNRIMPMAGDEMQAKMMRWVMPAMFVVFMLFVPSGLGVYIFVNIVLSLIQTAIQVGTSRAGEAKGSA